MKNMTKALAVFLVLVLMMQLFPLSVFADDTAGSVQVDVTQTAEASPEDASAAESQQQSAYVVGEMPGLRSQSEKHFRMNDGSFVAVDYGAPVHFSADGGETWEDIDNTLALSRDDAELYVAKNGDSVRGFAASLHDGQLFTVSNGDYSLRMGLASDADNADREMRNSSVSAEISYPDAKNRGNEELPFAEQITPAKLRADVLYRNVYDGVDLSYTLYSYNVKETIVLNQPRDSYSFSFVMDSKGLTPVLLENGSVDLLTTDGKAIYQIPSPYMYDADGMESNAVSYTLEEAESGAWTLTVTADAEWINANEREFPVAIDPTIYFAGNSTNQQIFSGYINDNSPNTHPADSPYRIRCGNYQNDDDPTAGHAIGLIYVNKLPSIPENCAVTTSMLKLFQTGYSNSDTGYFNYPRLYTSQITDSSFSSNAAESFINSLTWNNLTDKVFYGGGSSPETRTTIDYTKCKKNTLGVHYFEITDTTRQWYEGSNDISRLLVLDDGQRNMSIDTRATFSGYHHELFGHQPQLVVLYRNTVGVEGYYDYHSQNIGRAGTASVSNFTLGLSLSVPVYYAPSQALPFGLTLTYNSPLSNANFTSSSSVHTKSYTTSATGYGWKTSVQQSVTKIMLPANDGTDCSWLVYTDADGTEHYFKRKNNTSDYEDEDGLGLTITVNSVSNPTTFTMKDKEKNTWTFLYGYLSSYEDNNGNALYYAYNGYDYSSGNNNWKPTSANTIYRVTSVWRKNSGVSSATKLVTLNYTNNRLSSIVDMAGRMTSFSYDTNDNLTAINYPDGQTATYTYSNATVTDPQTENTKTFHRLSKARDNEAQYEIRYSYWTESLLRVKTIEEYTGAVGSESAGAIMRGFKSSATATRFRYCGADNTLGTNDDLIVQYYFDHWGRPINVATFDADETNLVGVSVGAYKQNKDANKDNNRMTHAAASGLQSVNLVYNSGMEHRSNGTGDLYGWAASGNGSVAARATSNTSGTTEVTPRTGAYMMKLYLQNASAGKESCYQNVYLTKDETYVFSGYVNTAAVSDTGTVGAYLSFRTSSGADINGASSRILNYKTNTAVDNGWERLEAVFTPTQSGMYQVAVNLSHMATVVLADDLQLEKTTDLGGIEGEVSASSANLIQLGGFELPAASGTSSAGVSQFWTFSMNPANTEYRVTVEDGDDQTRGKVIRLHNAPNWQVRATQSVILNAPATRTYLVSAWGKTPVGYTSDGSDMKYNNMTYERFFGIIAAIYYAGYSTPEYQYVAFNCAIDEWQYTSGMIVPKETDRTVERIELSIAGDLMPNDTYVDDVTLIQEPVQSYTYDANGNLTDATNTEGQTKTELDSQERLKKYTAMTGVAYNLHYANTTTRDPDYMTSGGVKTSYEYESSGSVKKTTDQATTGGKKLESSTSYDSTLNFVASSTDTNGSTVTSNYDAATGTLTTAADPKGTVTHHLYVSGNDRIRQTYVTGLDALHYNYNQKGQTEELSRKSFDLNQNAFWQGYHFDYDAWGNTTEIKVWKPTSGTAATPTGDTASLAKYQYNSNGTLSRMEYPNGDYVIYSYDLLDRLVKEVYYNSDDSIQVEYQYIYSSDGQLAKQQAIRNGTVVESYRFEYDSLGRLIRSREGGDNNSVQRTEHLYDGANRLTAQNWTVGERSFTEAYAYDAADGTMSAMLATYDDGSGWFARDMLTYTYDDLNRLTQVLDTENYSTQFYTRNYTYQDLSGDRTTSRLAQYVYRKPSDSSIIYGNSYAYDANGNITQINEVYTVNGADASRTLVVYTYDDLNQLTQETRYTYAGTSTTPAATTTVNYTIDTAGNLCSVIGGEHSVSYTYGDSAWSDKLTGITVDGVTRTITYADAANPFNWYNGTDYTNLTWTQGRRLGSVTKGSDLYSYEYDMSGVRSVKIADGLRHEYVTQNGRVVRESVYGLNSNTGEYTVFQYALDFLYDESGHPFLMRRYYNEAQTSYNTYHYVLNAQGDVIKLLHGQNTTVAEYTYDAWGNVLTATGSLADVNPLRYRGYYFDAETGFYYLQSRYYDPIVKRFLNADSYASTGQGFLGYNMFAYCGNAPAIAADNNGHKCVSIEINDGGGLTPPPPDYRTYEDQTVSQLNNCYSYAFELPYSQNPGYSIKGSSRRILKPIFRIAYSSKSPSKSVVGMALLVMADMKNENKRCRLIKSPSDARMGEYVVAMKTSDYMDSRNLVDFHFAVLLSDETWADKMGDDSVRRNAISGYDNSWPLNGINSYCSPTVFFAVGG